MLASLLLLAVAMAGRAAEPKSEQPNADASAEMRVVAAQVGMARVDSLPLVVFKTDELGSGDNAFSLPSNHPESHFGASVGTIGWLLSQDGDRVVVIDTLGRTRRCIRADAAPDGKRARIKLAPIEMQAVIDGLQEEWEKRHAPAEALFSVMHDGVTVTRVTRAYVVAAFLTRQGRTDPAYRIFRQCQAYRDQPPAALLPEVQRDLAAARYAYALRELTYHRDWALYANDAKAVLDDFGAVWPHADALRARLPALQGRAALDAAPPVDANADASQRRIAAILDAHVQDMVDVPIAFITPLTPEQVEAFGPERTMRIHYLAALPLRDALPALVALLPDPTLTPTLNTRIGTPDDALAFPATRGELARYILRLNLPDAEDLDDGALTAAALTMAREHGADSDTDLALLYLGDGQNSAQIHAALRALLDAPDPARHAVAIEAALLRAIKLTPSRRRTGDLAQRYAALRGDAAGDFLQRYYAAAAARDGGNADPAL